MCLVLLNTLLLNPLEVIFIRVHSRILEYKQNKDVKPITLSIPQEQEHLEKYSNVDV